MMAILGIVVGLVLVVSVVLWQAGVFAGGGGAEASSAISEVDQEDAQEQAVRDFYENLDRGDFGAAKELTIGTPLRTQRD